MPLQTREIRFLEALDAYKSGYSNSISQIVRDFDGPVSIIRYRLTRGSPIKRGGYNKYLNTFQEAAIRELQKLLGQKTQGIQEL